MTINNKNNSELKVAIIGGGFGGAAAAVALHNIGVKADLYEQAASIKEVGAGIGMRPPTVAYFRDWGIHDAIISKSSESHHMEVLNGNGDTVVKERWPQLTDTPNEKWSRLIHRADFISTFMDHLPPESVHLNHKYTSITNHKEYAEVHFENGKTVEADLVIGADGIRSKVRSEFFGDMSPVYSGTHAYRTVLNPQNSYDLVPDNTFKVYVADSGAMIYLLPLHHRNQVSFDITVPSEDASWRPAVTTEELLKYVEGFNPIFTEIVEKLTIDDFTCRALYDIDPIEKWTKDCITLLGDAAHAMLHHQGQGANQAIQDAGALAESIRDADTIQEALQKYENRRKPVAVKYQELSRLDPKQNAITAFPEKEMFEKTVE